MRSGAPAGMRPLNTMENGYMSIDIRVTTGRGLRQDDYVLDCSTRYSQPFTQARGQDPAAAKSARDETTKSMRAA